MMQEQDLSKYATFNVEDIVNEASTKKSTGKEATAYLDRSFLINMINEHNRQAALNTLDFEAEKLIDLIEYNFTGADFRELQLKDFQLFNFTNCDISYVHLDRIAIEFFHEYMMNNKVSFQGLNFEEAYLGPVICTDFELGIECNLYLNLSNLNLAGSNFRRADIKGLILDKTNIAGCDFSDCQNLDPKQFAFSVGFESAIFSMDHNMDNQIKEKIAQYSTSLNHDSYYAQTFKPKNRLMAYLAKLTNILDD